MLTGGLTTAAIAACGARPPPRRARAARPMPAAACRGDRGPFPATAATGRTCWPTAASCAATSPELRRRIPASPRRLDHGRADVLDVTDSGKALAGAAVYRRHCTIDGTYSLYDERIASENSGAASRSPTKTETHVQTIFAAAYSGRCRTSTSRSPSLAAATSGGAGSRPGSCVPEDVCSTVYATSEYEQSISTSRRPRSTAASSSAATKRAGRRRSRHGRRRPDGQARRQGISTSIRGDRRCALGGGSCVKRALEREKGAGRYADWVARPDGLRRRAGVGRVRAAARHRTSWPRDRGARRRARARRVRGRCRWRGEQRRDGRSRSRSPCQRCPAWPQWRRCPPLRRRDPAAAAPGRAVDSASSSAEPGSTGYCIPTSRGRLQVAGGSSGCC